MNINDIIKQVMEITKPLPTGDERIFLLVYIRMLLRDIGLSDAQIKLEEMKNAMKYYYSNNHGNDVEQLAEAFLRSNI